MPTYEFLVDHPEAGPLNITALVRSTVQENALGERASTLSIELRQTEQDLAPPDLTMADITFKVDGVRRFFGSIKSHHSEPQYNVIYHKLDCVDNTDRMYRRLVNGVYSNQTAKQILQAMCLKYAPYIDTTDVQDFGGVIEEIRFDYDTLGAAVAKMADVVGAYWNLDENNKLHFFATNRGAGDFWVTGGDFVLGSLKVESSAAALVNRIWIIGAKAAASSYIEQFFTGDGNNNMWPLLFVPNYPEVWENGATKTIEVDKGIGSTSDKHYTYDKKNKILRRVAGAPASGVVVRFKYRPTVQVVDFFEDTTSINKYGVYEKAVRDKKIADKMAARKRGKAELQRVKEVIRRVSFQTRARWQLTPGFVHFFNLPNQGLASNFRVDRVSVQFLPDDIVADVEAQEVDF